MVQQAKTYYKRILQMTTDYNDVDLQYISPFSFWKQRIDTTIVPIHKKNIEALEKKMYQMYLLNSASLISLVVVLV